MEKLTKKQKQIKKAKIYFAKQWNKRMNEKLDKFPLICLNDLL